jgi:hypothetical protein
LKTQSFEVQPQAGVGAEIRGANLAQLAIGDVELAVFEANNHPA